MCVCVYTNSHKYIRVIIIIVKLLECNGSGLLATETHATVHLVFSTQQMTVEHDIFHFALYIM